MAIASVEESELLIEPIQYYKSGWMKSHPFYHDKKGKQLNESELEYLCKFYEYDDITSLSFALGRPPKSLQTKVYTLKKQGLYTYYKHLNKHW